jgi:hypothetical protein
MISTGAVICWVRPADSTPTAIHHGHAQERRAARALVLDATHVWHPERFVRCPLTSISSRRPESCQLKGAHLRRCAP